MNLGQEIPNENFTQKDLMLHLLQVSQHTVTREDIKEDIAKVEIRFDKVDKIIKSLATKEELTKVETSLKADILKVETSLKADNLNLGKSMDRFMFWSLSLTITSTFLILTLMYKMMPN